MSTSFKNHFLIAMPSLLDPNFFRSVTYLCEHNSEGATGIVINQPLPSIRLNDILEQIGIHTAYPEVANRVVFNGGPVQKDRGFILHSSNTVWNSTLKVSQQISLTTSPDILKAIAQNQGPTHALIALGYAHWQAGQLEQELAANTWLYGPANFDILFYMAIEHRWRAAATAMGVDINRLSSDIGHA